MVIILLIVMVIVIVIVIIMIIIEVCGLHLFANSRPASPEADFFNTRYCLVKVLYSSICINNFSKLNYCSLKFVQAYGHRCRGDRARVEATLPEAEPSRNPKLTGATFRETLQAGLVHNIM